MDNDSLWDSFTKKVEKLKTKRKLERSSSHRRLKVTNFETGSRIDIYNIQNLNDKTPELAKGKLAGLNNSTAKQFKQAIQYDAKLDLHGRTLEEAIFLFEEFVKKNFIHNKRKLIIVTGKGNLTPLGYDGKIKIELPKWINRDSIRPLILAFDQAPPAQGGEGAYIILLKKYHQ